MALLRISTTLGVLVRAAPGARSKAPASMQHLLSKTIRVTGGHP
jgi:hypothetical protein